VVTWCAARYIRLVWRTGRWSVENTAAVEDFVRARKPFIACFWHGRLLMIPQAWPYDAPMSILISRHRDGRLIAETIARLGIGTITGSSSKGGRAALRGMLRALEAGEYIGITPDGPRGPRMRVGAGVIRAASLARVPIVPVTYSASRRRVFRSWDRFILALPFSRGIIRVGDMIEPPDDNDEIAVERARHKLETSLNEMTRELDVGFGLPPIEAAPVAGDSPNDKTRDTSGMRPLEDRS